MSTGQQTVTVVAFFSGLRGFLMVWVPCFSPYQRRHGIPRHARPSNRAVAKRLVPPETGAGETDIVKAMNACVSYTRCIAHDSSLEIVAPSVNTRDPPNILHVLSTRSKDRQRKVNEDYGILSIYIALYEHPSDVPERLARA